MPNRPLLQLALPPNNGTNLRVMRYTSQQLAASGCRERNVRQTTILDILPRL
ncbi:hypothetical protein BIFGAL_03953 [Bifidobacterium gallicum DSM 20093 = LMG 11596]|uniref:Uncharacterized protein n=1 Tax=Bifidobacterium gallicum DSM 20093 = LMG 11596 TaxID=561180 RepID=D1NVR1_9BIFI|nr:hypothetical protein BIFGAL_03953 [Bifidobacterium gallicum DSM 20093 = LMG 11596]